MPKDTPPIARLSRYRRAFGRNRRSLFRYSPALNAGRPVGVDGFVDCIGRSVRAGAGGASYPQEAGM